MLKAMLKYISNLNTVYC